MAFVCRCSVGQLSILKDRSSSRPVPSVQRGLCVRVSPHSTSITQPHECRRRVWASADAGGAAAAAQTTSTEVFVEEVMNPHPVLLQDSMPIKDAVHKMLDANVAGAPVVNEAGELVGVLSESDIIWKGAGRPEDHFIIPPIFIGFADAFIYLRDNKRFDEEVHKILAKTVAEAMVGREKVISVNSSTAMSEAAHLMLHHDVNLLPVVEPGNKVVGVITRHDILRGIYASKSPFL